MMPALTGSRIALADLSRKRERCLTPSPAPAGEGAERSEVGEGAYGNSGAVMVGFHRLIWRRALLA
jgi:hypothetical protein